MALNKIISTKFGINAEYWKIVDLNINWLDNRSHVSLLGWADKEARDAGNQCLDQRSFSFSGDNFPFENKEENNTAIAYEAIKAIATSDEEGEEIVGEFSDAEDV